MIFFSSSFAQPKKGSEEQKVHKYDPTFSGIGPKVYILPPPKSEQQILEENYVIKWQNLSQIEELIKYVQQKKRLNFFAQVSRPANIRSVDWAKFTVVEKLNAALQFFQGQSGQHTRADILNNLANFYLLKDEFRLADSLYNESLRIKKLRGYNAETMSVLENMAILKVEQRDYETALRYFQILLEDPRTRNDMNRRAAIFMEIAKIEAAQGHYAAAQNIGITKTITIYKKTKNFRGIVQTLNTLASFMLEQQKYVEAKWYYLQAIDVAETYSNSEGLAQSLYNLGVLKNTIQDYALAIDDFKRAGEIADRLSMQILLLQVKSGLGDSYLRLGDYTSATVLLDEYNLIKSTFVSNQKILN